jgi:eukaryotic-like serine/threonine-protein kinase
MNYSIGESIGQRYRILELLGSGVHGAVYKVLDTRLQRLAALKLLHFELNAEALRVFLLGSVAFVRLRHPNLVQVYDANQDETFAYLTFEYIEGPTLDRLIADAKPLDPDYAIEIVGQVGAGLEHAHLHGVIHRDVKPGNILISNDGRVLLADFALAIAPGVPTLTHSGTIAGTPAYMSPEQVMGKPVDARSDIFSLGIVFYELLTGRKPFSAESQAKLFAKIVEEEPASPRQINHLIPSSINEIVLKSLAKEPGQRFQTADDFLRALDGSNPHIWHRETDKAAPSEGLAVEGLSNLRAGLAQTQMSDSLMSVQTDDALLPSSLELRAGQQDQRACETEIDLAPYSPPSSASVEALPVDPTPEANERLREFDDIWDQLIISVRHD